MLAAAVSSRNQRTWMMWSWTRAMFLCWGPQVGSEHAHTQRNLAAVMASHNGHP